MTAREVAFKSLGEYRRTKTWPEITLGKLSAGLSARDLALALQIVNGVIQNMTYCDYIISHFSSVGIKKLEPRVLDILRMSIYQIIFLTRVPNSAAVYEGVKLAEKYANPRAVSYVNAVLRKAAGAAECGDLPEVKGDTEISRLSVAYSHPEWLVREFCVALGCDGAEALLALNNSADTPVTAQVNTLLTDMDRTLTMLEANGVTARRHEWLENCIQLHRAGDIEKMDAFKRGYFYIQDAAARLAVIAADPKPGDFVLDGCAAPGGKSFAAAITMKNTGRIVAFDINAAKLPLIKAGAERLGIGIIKEFEKDASATYGLRTTRLEEKESLIGRVDIVLADVPCSGFGVIRKKPEIRYKTESGVAGLPDIQKQILSALSAYVKPGGKLLYSSCTVLKQENEDVIEWFLRENDQFYPDGYRLPHIGYISDGMTTLWPHIHGTDGFFICRLKRCS